MPWMGRGNVLEIACSPANTEKHPGVAARQLCLSDLENGQNSAQRACDVLSIDHSSG